MYPIFTCFLIFAIFTFLFMNRSSSSFSKNREDFFNREREANNVRRQPLTDLNYIKVDFSAFPEINTDDPYILEKLNTLKILSESESKIVNLSSYTNTDLKIKYGVANLTILTEYDQNFTNLCRCLYELGKRLYETNDSENAKVFLEYGVKYGTDLKSHYTLLADIYEDNMQYKEIVALIKSARNIQSALKNSLIEDLTKRLEGTNYSADTEEKVLEDISS